MKIILLLISLLLAPFAAAFRMLMTPPGLVAANNAGSHDGPIRRVAEVAFPQVHLIAGKGTTAGVQVSPCAATGQLPIGFAVDEAAVGEHVGVDLSKGDGKLGVASAAIAADVLVYTSGSGKMNSTGGTGKYLMGRSITAAAADGDEFEFDPCFPALQP